MSLKAESDYLLFEKINNGREVANTGVFVGTQNKFYFFTDQKIDYSRYTTTTHKVSFAGESLNEVVDGLLGECSSVEDLELNLDYLKNELSRTSCRDLNEISGFTFFSNLFWKGVTVQQTDADQFEAYICKFKKDHKQRFLAFYSNHPKFKD